MSASSSSPVNESVASGRAEVASRTVSFRSRRSALVAAAVSVVVVAGLLVAWQVGAFSDGPDLPKPPVVIPPVTGAVLRIAPDGTGSGNTDQWSDAAPLSALPDILKNAAPGTQVWLRADAGPYQLGQAIPLHAGGKPGNPIIIRGVDSDGDPRAAELIGDRADPYDPRGSVGKEVFRLLAGADHLVFQELRFRNVGNGAFRIAADITDLTIRQVTAANVRRFIENNVSDAETATATVSGLNVTNVAVHGYSRGVARLRYDSNRILFDGVTGDAQGQDGDPFTMGIHLSDTVHDVDIRNTAMSNSVSTKGPYWNGDGFSAEKLTYDLRFFNTHATGNTDAGYDLKSRSAHLTEAVAVDNKRNFRFWGNISVDGCLSADPHLRGGTGTQAQLHATAAAVVTVSRCDLTDDDPRTIVFDVDGTARLAVTDSTVSRAPESRLETVEPGADLDVERVEVR